MTTGAEFIVTREQMVAHLTLHGWVPYRPFDGMTEGAGAASRLVSAEHGVTMWIRISVKPNEAPFRYVEYYHMRFNDDRGGKNEGSWDEFAYEDLVLFTMKTQIEGAKT